MVTNIFFRIINAQFIQDVKKKKHFSSLVGDTLGQARRAHLESLFIFWLQFVEKRGVVF